MKYNVTISCLGHNFNVKNIEATNKDDAQIKAEKYLKKSIYTVTVTPVKTDIVDDLMKMLKIKK